MHALAMYAMHGAADRGWWASMAPCDMTGTGCAGGCRGGTIGRGAGQGGGAGRGQERADGEGGTDCGGQGRIRGGGGGRGWQTGASGWLLTPAAAN